MKVLVYPHAAAIGGSQLNAIETAAAFRDRGHHVLVVSHPGTLLDRVRQLRLPHILLDARARGRPSPYAAAQLTSLARQHGCDVVHGYEWPPAVEAFAGPRLRLGLPAVCTIGSMTVAPFLPRTMPLIVCMDENKHRALAAGHGLVTLIEPPVDVRANTPDYDPGTVRADLDIPDHMPLVAVVSRLAPELKLEGLLSACDAVGELAASGTQIHFLIVGDGPVRPLVAEAAAAANSRAGGRVVTFAGQLDDPRPAYAAADVVLGMGGSALRGLAFGKPVVVQGECGFWELLTPESAPLIRRQGWYGLGPQGDGRPVGAVRLTRILRGLLDDPASWARLGRYGRSLVVENFSLDQAAATQEDVYATAIAAAGRVSNTELAADAARTGLGVARHKLVRKWQRWRGTAAPADFGTAPWMPRR